MSIPKLLFKSVSEPPGWTVLGPGVNFGGFHNLPPDSFRALGICFREMNSQNGASRGREKTIKKR